MGLILRIATAIQRVRRLPPEKLQPLTREQRENEARPDGLPAALSRREAAASVPVRPKKRRRRWQSSRSGPAAPPGPYECTRARPARAPRTPRRQWSGPVRRQAGPRHTPDAPGGCLLVGAVAPTDRAKVGCFPVTTTSEPAEVFESLRAGAPPATGERKCASLLFSYYTPSEPAPVLGLRGVWWGQFREKVGSISRLTPTFDPRRWGQFRRKWGQFLKRLGVKKPAQGGLGWVWCLSLDDFYASAAGLEALDGAGLDERFQRSSDLLAPLAAVGGG